MGWRNDYGDWLRKRIAAEFVIEQDGWAVERVRRVANRLQAHVPVADRLEVLVPWIDEHTAFTAPGRYIYFCRRLLERCTTDEVAAMVIAHEIAHHDLGHLGTGGTRFLPLRLLLRKLQRTSHSRKREIDADRRAIELCLDAGYEPEKCLQLYNLMSHISLDYGDTVGVFGLDGDERELKKRSHPALQRREQAVREHLKTLMEARSTGEGAFRHTQVRSHCGHCPNPATAPCAHCDKPLCEDHGQVTQATCISCGAAPGPLCRVCKRTDQCLRCGTSHYCRYCKAPAEVACPGCNQVFCQSHAPKLESQCVPCRVEADNARESRAKNAKLGLAVALVLAVVIALCWSLLGGPDAVNPEYSGSQHFVIP